MVGVPAWGPSAPSVPRLARSLRRLGRTVDEAWPDRSRKSDGWVGDAAHTLRVSDHNPDHQGIVHAVDITARGIRPWPVVIAALLHPATNYVIFSGLIWSRSTALQPVRYTGVDPHLTHLHVSIRHARSAEQSTAEWLDWSRG
jgi:hypothetical protein